MPIVPASSVPLFAFANDGTLAWLRTSGSRVLAVDPKTGEVIREVRLDPAPFGITWSIERHGRFFVVRDDRELAAYDEGSGARLWKRAWPARALAIVSEHEGKHLSVAPGPEGVDVATTDLATGEIATKLRVEGTMRHVGAHGLVVANMLFFATDQRDVFAVDVAGFRVAARHAFAGAHVLRPIATAAGVHVAAVERRASGHVTRVATFDATTGALASSYELPGEAYALSPGASGLVVDVRRTPTSPPERVAFRPEAPRVHLTVARSVALSVLGDGRAPSAPPPPRVEVLAPSERPLPPREGDEIRPPSRGRAGGNVSVARADEGSPREGFVALLAMLGARSEVLTRFAEALADGPRAAEALRRIGLRLVDPRVRWTALSGRDPCLLDLGEDARGDAIATYLYPPAPSARVPVVRVRRGTCEATWLANDLDAFVAGLLDDARGPRPDLVDLALDALGLDRRFPRPLAPPAPPRFFFEAHEARFTFADADAAVAAGDLEGAERMLVSLGRCGLGRAAKDRLAQLYDRLGWHHQRATVVETW